MDEWPKHRLEVLATVILFVSGALVVSSLAPVLELRPGVELADPILALLRPRDASWLTFTALYSSVGYAVWVLRRCPSRFLAGFQACALVTFFRAVAIAVTPLAAPAGIIPLTDPFVALLVRTDFMTKDLFFSGHTATCTLLVLVVRRRRERLLLLALGAVVVGCILVQHVHYTVDVLAAPPFTLVAWLATVRLRRFLGAPPLAPAGE